MASGASGGFTITLPTTAQIISAMGPTIPTDGTYGQLFSVLNDGVGRLGRLHHHASHDRADHLRDGSNNSDRWYLWSTVLGAERWRRADRDAYRWGCEHDDHRNGNRRRSEEH